ncbi:IS3 family transposase [Cytobacillus firmus]
MICKYQTINELKDKYPIIKLCHMLGVVRSSYYKYMKREAKKQVEVEKSVRLKRLIREIYNNRKGVFGYRRITIELEKQYNNLVSPIMVYRLMKEMGLKAVIRKRRKNLINKSKSTYTGNIYDNELNRKFSAKKPGEKWVTDITQLSIGPKKYYLSVIMDLFNNEIISYNVSRMNDNYLVLDTLEKARSAIDNLSGILLHSDQGHQYTSNDYKKYIATHNILPSMSRKGNCIDNACIESFFSHFKEECYRIEQPQSEDELIVAIRDYIHFYNHERCQLKLNKLAPVEYRHQLAA